MFRRTMDAIIADGTRNLERLAQEASGKAKEAAAEVSRCQGELQTLVNLAKQVPEKVFDRYSNLLISTVEVHQPSDYSQIIVGGIPHVLRGLMGDEVLKKGKYRVLVLLEPIS